MRITLKEPELELEVNKVDTPTGAGWCVILTEDRKILIKFHHGKWETTDNISNEFLQEIGYEINQLLKADQKEKFSKSSTELNIRPKRARILKYLLI
jgi:translation initiation factor IF-3